MNFANPIQTNIQTRDKNRVVLAVVSIVCSLRVCVSVYWLCFLATLLKRCLMSDSIVAFISRFVSVMHLLLVGILTNLMVRKSDKLYSTSSYARTLGKNIFNAKAAINTM